MYSPIIPSVSSLSKSILKFLSNHPLLIHPIVYHSVTEEYIPISQYRFMGGIPTNDGLTCSIYPGFSSNDSDSPSSPATISASVLYKPYDLGAGEQSKDEAIYHFFVQYTHRGLTVDGFEPSTEEELIKVPANAIIEPKQIGLIDLTSTKNLEVYLNPSLDIVSDYIELTRLALCDLEHHKYFYLGNPFFEFPGTFKNIEIIHQDYNSIPWSKNTAAVFSTARLMFRITLYVTRGWRDKFKFPIETINVDTVNDYPNIIIK